MPKAVHVEALRSFKGAGGSFTFRGSRLVVTESQARDLISRKLVRKISTYETKVDPPTETPTVEAVTETSVDPGETTDSSSEEDKPKKKRRRRRVKHADNPERSEL